MIQEICEGADFSSIVVTQVEGDRKVEAEELAAVFRKYTKAHVVARESVKDAFETALELKGDGMLFCAGSLYLIGDIKAIINSQTVHKH